MTAHVPAPDSPHDAEKVVPVTESTPAESAATEPAAAAPRPARARDLFPGDTGVLSAPTRRALVQLIHGPMLSRERTPDLWEALLRDLSTVRSRLHELFLEVIVVEDAELAFVRNASGPELGELQTVRTHALTFLDTAMLLVLRQHLLTQGGETRVIVDSRDIFEDLQVYRGAARTDEARFLRRLGASWAKMQNYGILSTAISPGRAEISPVLRHLFGAEEVRAVRAEFARIVADPNSEIDLGATDPGDEPEEIAEAPAPVVDAGPSLFDTETGTAHE